MAMRVPHGCCRPRPPRGRLAGTLEVLMRDGEAFPVKRRLLRPCIALTHAVRSEAPAVAVDVDTLVFDRSAPLPAHSPGPACFTQSWVNTLISPLHLCDVL